MIECLNCKIRPGGSIKTVDGKHCSYCGRDLALFPAEAVMTNANLALLELRRDETLSWRKLSAIIKEISPDCGGHSVYGDCPQVGCRLFAAIREWGQHAHELKDYLQGVR